MSKYFLRFFFDAGAGTCLWSGDQLTKEKFGNPIDISKLPLDESIRRRVMYLSDWYDTSIDWSYPPNPSPWDVQEKKQFEDAVQEFLIDVRQALFPDFEVKDEHRPVS